MIMFISTLLSFVFVHYYSLTDASILCPTHSQNKGNNATVTLVSNPCKAVASDDETAPETGMPKRFRSMLTLDPPLRASASAQFCYSQEEANGGKAFVAHLKESSPEWPPVIVDLRQEAHAFVDGKPVAWYCPRNWEMLHKDGPDILKIESKRVESLMGQTVDVFKMPKCKDDEGMDACVDKPKKESTRFVNKIETEQAFVSANGMRYYRIPVADHRKPSDESVGAFVEMVKTEEELSGGHAFYHLHCKGGKGRATTFIALLDMMFHAHQLTFDQILQRQHIFGIMDLVDITKPGQRWKAEYAAGRLGFLRKFYDYCKDTNSGKNKSWSQWSNKDDSVLGLFGTKFEMVDRATKWLKKHL